MRAMRDRYARSGTLVNEIAAGDNGRTAIRNRGPAAPLLAPLLRDPAPVDRHRQPGHERRRLRTQPYHRLGDLLRLAHPAHRLGRLAVLLRVSFGRARLEHPPAPPGANYPPASPLSTPPLFPV